MKGSQPSACCYCWVHTLAWGRWNMDEVLTEISVFCCAALSTFLPSNSFKFPRPDFGAPSSLRNHQSSVPHNTSGVVFQLPGWSDASVAKLPPFPGVRNDKNGSWGKGRCLSQHHNRSPLSLTSWKWVCAWLVAMHLWVRHYISLCWAELMTLRFVWVCFERLGCSCLKFPLKYVHLALLVMSWISYCLYCTVSLLHRILTALIIPLTIQLD